MAGFSEKMTSEFSLELLQKVLDPAEDKDMARMVMGAYIVNARASMTGNYLIDDMIPEYEVSERETANHQIEALARRNLAAVAGMLGPRQFKVSVIDNASSAILDVDGGRGRAYPTNKKTITGRYNKYAVDRTIALAPPGHIEYLRIFPYHTPNFRRVDKMRSWYIKMVDDDLEPLVEIKTITPRAPVNQLFHWIKQRSRERYQI